MMLMMMMMMVIIIMIIAPTYWEFFWPTLNAYICLERPGIGLARDAAAAFPAMSQPCPPVLAAPSDGPTVLNHRGLAKGSTLIN